MQARTPDLISVSRLPHTAMRTAETYLKRQMFKLEDTSVRRLLILYRDAYADIREAANSAAERYGVTKVKRDRASSAWSMDVMSYARGRVNALLDAINREVITSTSAALTGGYYGRLWLLDMATREDHRINMPMLRGADILDSMQEDVYADLIQSLLGSQWRAQYELELDQLVLEIRRAIGQGLIQGEGIPEVMRRVADAMGVQTDRRRGRVGSAERRGYRANFNRIQAITRTVINQMSNAGAVNAYRANTDILSGYEWLTARDERVCPQCAGLNGKVYSFRSRFQPPAHVNCRCTVIPVVKSDVLEDPAPAPRRTFEKWIQGFGMERELANFLVPRS